MASIDSLSINISASTKSAKKNIDDLATSLDKLGSKLSNNINSTKLNSVAQSFTALAEATQKFGKSSDAIQNIPKLTTSLSEMMTTLSQAPQVSSQVIELANALAQLGENAKAFKETTEGLSGVSDVVNTGRELPGGSSDTEVVPGSNGVKEVEKQFIDVSKAVEMAKRSVSLFKAEVKGIKNAITGVISKIKQFGKDSEGTFKSGLKFVLKYVLGVKSLYILWKKFRTAIEDGNKNLVHFSTTFNTSMSKMKSAMYVLSNSISVAFAPLVNAIADAVTKLLKKIASAFNTIAKFLATLFGQAKVMQINTDFMYDYADSLDSASSSAKKFIAPFDEINQRSSTSSGGSSGGVDPTGLFSEELTGDKFQSLIDKLKEAWENADFFDIGEEIGEKIIEALYSVPWDKIQAVAGKLGKSLASLLVGVLSAEFEDHSFGDSIGYTIGNAIQTGIEFAYNFVKRFTEGDGENSGWYLLGKNIADAINTGFEQIDWSMLGQTINMWVRGWLETITTAIEQTDWYQIGVDIGTMLSEIDWKGIVMDFKELAEAVWKAIKEVIKGWKETDPEGFGIVATIVSVLALIHVSDLVSKITTGTSLGANVLKSVCKVIKNNFTTGGVLSELGGSGALSNTVAGGIAKAIGGTITTAGTILFTVEIAFLIKEAMESWSSYKNNLDTYGSTMGKRVSANENQANPYNEDSNYSKKQAERTSLTDWFDKISEKVQTLTGNYKILGDSVNDVDGKTSTFNGTIKGGFGAIGTYDDWVKTASTDMTGLYAPATNSVKTSTEDMSKSVQTTNSTLGTSLSSKWGEIKSNATSKWGDIKTSVTNKVEELKTNVNTKWENLKTNTSTKWDNIKSTVSTKVNALKTDASSKLDTFKSSVATKWDNINSSASSKWDTIKSTISGKINAIKGLANFSWSLPTPSIKLPHISVKWNTHSMGKYSFDLPSFDVSYYKNGGYIPNGMGSLFVAGESGSEIVSQGTHGTGVMNESEMANAIKQAVIEGMMEVTMANSSSNSNSGSVEIPMYIDGREVTRAVVSNMESMIRGGQLKPSFI